MPLIFAGKLSLQCFICSLFSLTILNLKYAAELFIGKEVLLPIHAYLLVASYFVVLFIIIKIFLKDYLFEVALRALFLGDIFSIGLIVAVDAPSSYKVFGLYMCVISFFHFSEFLSIAIANPETLSLSSYILNHSLDYKIAALASWTEFFIERYYFPELKTIWSISALGVTICIYGEVIRKIAITTAKCGFTHTVQNTHKPNHVLVTHGVYGWSRHPSYVGWFYWAFATQIILVNPICSVAYLLASWKFFYDRIIAEEMTLLTFFGQDYMDYQKNVPTRIPFIKGYLIDEFGYSE